MVQPTPWQRSREQQAQGITTSVAESARRRRTAVGFIATRRRHLRKLKGNWGYLFNAVGSGCTFSALFQPWINASATDGTIRATPFGKFEISSSLVALWSGSPPPTAKINGMWAVLACVAIALTVALVAVNFRTPTPSLSRFMVASSTAMSLFVAFALVHMNHQAPAIRNMVGNGPAREPGSVAGLVIRWASGNSSYALPGVRRYTWVTAGLTSWAWFAGVMAVLSVTAAIGQWAYNRRSGLEAQPVSMSLTKTRLASQPDSAD
ncbi:hypothetical protein [Nocardia brasiliensis]|uniref:hypothetical protein n=1 Tax=Nocardia brasiliensis TaxID=37326 RepID=UPI0024540982|nr:hypothetical protein [Nocardia brasiliensis]